MPIQSREQLKSYFRNGTLAREEYFQDLIDSSVNKLNDNIVSDQQSGLGFIAALKSGRLLSFFKNISNQRDNVPSLVFELIDGANASEGVSLTVPGNAGNKNLFIQNVSTKSGVQGRVGVNTSTPACELDVNGTVGMKGRTGRFKDPSVDPNQLKSDGQWHKVITNLKGFNAYEILAAAYDPDGAYAMCYTLALNVFGNGNCTKPISQAYKRRKYRIQLRWLREKNGTYSLEARTRVAYKNQRPICFRITKLWS